MIVDKLHDEVVSKGMVCVGLDIRMDYIPDFITKKYDSKSERIFAFNRLAIDAAREKAACFKLQIACYEAEGIEGMKAYAGTLDYLREKDLLSIADAKRGDISSTAGLYAKAHFSGEFEADFMTVNPYMGEDAISPYFDYVKNKNKGLFVLVKTSNPSAVDFQERILSGGNPLYIETAKKVGEWGAGFIGKSGYSSIGGVVGIKNTREFHEVRKACPGMFFLVPGYGAQGGTGKDIKEAISDPCAVVNSSRGIIAHAWNAASESDFMDAISGRVEKMGKDLSNE